MDWYEDLQRDFDEWYNKIEDFENLGDKKNEKVDY